MSPDPALTVPPPSGPGSGEPERLTPVRLVSRFLLVPILVTAVCVAIFLMFGLLSYEPKDPFDYLREIKISSGERRWEAALGLSRILENPSWQAAFGLSKRIVQDPAMGRDERLVREVIALFEEARGQDPRIRRYLALALGRLGNPLASDALLGALGDEDPETQIHVMWALGALRETRAVEPLTALLRHRDEGVRKMAAYTLGALGDARAAEPLARALEDPAVDVGWNAAIALSRLGDRRGVPVLLRLLDPATLAAEEAMSPQQRQDTAVEAIRALVSLREVSARPAIKSLRESSPDLKVRQTAIDALESWD